MLLILLAEVGEGAQDRVRGGLAQAAEGGVLDNLGETLEALDVFHRAPAVRDAVEDLQHAAVADAAGRTLAAGLVHGEFEEELRDGDHAVVLIHDDHAAGAHHRSGRREAFVVDGDVQVLLGEAAAGGAAGLDGLELLAALDAAADVVDDLAERRAHRDFDEADVVDLAGEGEDLGTLGLLGADGGEPRRALGQDDRHVGEGLDVVDVGRTAHVAGFGRERRLERRLAALAFHRVDEGGLFAADERAGAVADFDVEVEPRAENVLAEQAVFAGLGDGNLEPLDGERVFGADVDEAVVGVDAPAADHHGFDDRIRVAFHDGTVHERARIAFVRIADDVFVGGVELAGDFPLQSGREAGAAAAAQAAGLDVGEHLGAVALQAVGQGLVAVAGDVLQDVLRIDETAVAERDAHLLAVEIHVLGVTDVGAGGRVLVEQALDLLALDDVRRDDLFHVIRTDGGVEGVVRHNFDNGAFLAEAEAAGNEDVDLVGDPAFLQHGLETFYDPGTFGGLATGTAAAAFP